VSNVVQPNSQLQRSWLFEEYLPRVDFFKDLAISDHVDIFCYTLSCALAAVFWKLQYRQRVGCR